jgi:hypothetical protein
LQNSRTYYDPNAHEDGWDRETRWVIAGKDVSQIGYKLAVDCGSLDPDEPVGRHSPLAMHLILLLQLLCQTLETARREIGARQLELAKYYHDEDEIEEAQYLNVSVLKTPVSGTYTLVSVFFKLPRN